MSRYRTPAVVTRRLAGAALPDAFVDATVAAAARATHLRGLASRKDERRLARKVRKLAAPFFDGEHLHTFETLVDGSTVELKWTIAMDFERSDLSVGWRGGWEAQEASPVSELPPGVNERDASIRALDACELPAIAEELERRAAFEAEPDFEP